MPAKHVSVLTTADSRANSWSVKSISVPLVYAVACWGIVVGKVCYQLTGSSDFTLKSLPPVNWQQRIYVKISAAS